jgi:hypothetical protein
LGILQNRIVYSSAYPLEIVQSIVNGRDFSAAGSPTSN